MSLKISLIGKFSLHLCLFVSSQFVKENGTRPIEQRSPTFSAPRTGFMKASFPTHGEGVVVRKDAGAGHPLCTLLLFISHQPYLRSQALDPGGWGPPLWSFPGSGFCWLKPCCVI